MTTADIRGAVIYRSTQRHIVSTIHIQRMRNRGLMQHNYDFMVYRHIRKRKKKTDVYDIASTVLNRQGDSFGVGSELFITHHSII
jgi:hypothetical protein